MRVMLDNSIPGHSQLCDWEMGPQGPLFGPRNQHFEVLGLRRKTPNPNPVFQSEIDSLFTVGRLIREGKIVAFTYSELDCESMWQHIGDPGLDALAECKIERCPPAVDRSRFQGGLFPGFARKGGKRDRKTGLDSSHSQIAFMQLLCDLTNHSVSELISLGKPRGLTDFEIESLRNLSSFKQLCRLSGSAENYPDMFHLWTAQRNKMEAFLTLDSKLANIANQIGRTKGVTIDYPTKVLRPSELLSLLGVEKLDPIPLPHGQFYTLIDLWKDAPRERFALFRVSPR